MNSRQLDAAMAQSARRLASRYLPKGYRGPIIDMPAALKAAVAKGTAETRYNANSI